MAKTLNQLPVAASPQATDILLIEQGGLDRQIPYANGSLSLLESLWTTFSPRVAATLVNVAQTANTVPWGHITGAPTTTAWGTITSPPTTLAGYGITDAVRNNTDGSITGNLTITGALTVTGVITFSGTTTQVNSTQVNLTDNIININSGLAGAPPSNLQAGIQVNRGTSTAYLFIWDESTQTFRIGQTGSLEAVATREDAPTTNAIPFWNNTLKEYNSSGVTVSGTMLTGNLTGNVTGTASLATLATTATTANAVSFNNGLTTIASVTFGAVTATGNITGSTVTNAVWNDIADFVEIGADVPIQPGRAYVRSLEGAMKISQEYMQKGVMGVVSDTFGFGVGQKPFGTPQLPIAIGGYVLAYVDAVYEPGTPLTCSPNGVLTEFKLPEKRDYPERMLAIFDRAEKNPIWNGVSVNGRHWVKVV
jgi:hypothetical protein